MPQLHDETFANALRDAAGFGETNVSIEERLSQIPTIESLADLPEGTPVWIRADLDVADHDGVIGDDPRLASLHETLAFGRERGWRMLLTGHRGRTPERTLEYVHQKLKDTEPGCGPFIRDWFDEHAETLTGVAVKAVESLKPGQFLVFENVRRYSFEQRLWTAVEEQLGQITDHFQRVASAFRQGATVYVNDAIAAGNKDFSSAALPLAMGRAALGVFIMRVRSGLDVIGDMGEGAEDVSQSAPLPMIGADIRWNFADRWMFQASGQFLGISIDDTVDGSWREIRAAIEYNLARNFGVAATLTEAALREFEYRYEFSGPQIYGFVNF